MCSLLDTRRTFVLILAIGLFAMAARSVTDPDVWWHLKTGQLILSNHAVVHADPYSFTRHGQPWVNHEWLSDVLIFATYRGAGRAGLIVIFAWITSATFMLAFFRCEGGTYIAGAFAVWSAIASGPSWGVRPQTITLLFAGLFLLLLERSYVRPNLLWGILPLMLVWVNLHAGFALGIALILLFLVGDALQVWISSATSVEPSGSIRRLAFLLLGCLAIVPLNPYGARMYWYPFETVHSQVLQSYIAEWFSPNFHQAMYLPALFLTLAMFVAVAVAVAVSPLRLRCREWLLLSATTWAALHSARHIPIFALVAAPLLSKLVKGWWVQKKPMLGSAEKDRSHSSRRQISNGIVLAACLLLTFLKVRHVVGAQAEVERRAFPWSAVAFLRESKLPGPLFNSYNWGGYLIWQLQPDYPVYIDGRADLYWDEFFHQFAGTYELSSASWAAPLQRWHIQTVLVPPDAPIASALSLLNGWSQVYRDSQAVIFQRIKP